MIIEVNKLRAWERMKKARSEKLSPFLSVQRKKRRKKCQKTYKDG